VPPHKFTKKELKQDGFVDTTEKVLEFLQRNATAVGAGLLALVVLLVGGSYLQQSRQAAQVEASYMLFQGQQYIDQGDFEAAVMPLRDCVEEHGGTEFGRYARVALVHAMAGAGQVDLALQRADEFAAELAADHPASRELAVVRANVLADAGRYAEAASAMAGLITPDLEDRIYIQRTFRQAEWLREAGDGAGAIRVLEELRDKVAAGEVAQMGSEVQNQLELARALQR